MLEAEHIERALAVDRQLESTWVTAGHQGNRMAQAPIVPAATRAPRLGTSHRHQRERENLPAMLATHPGSRADLAQELGISLRSLYRRLRELDAEG